VDSLEIDRGGTSFSIDTVLAIRKKFPYSELLFLIGEDNADLLADGIDMENWRSWFGSCFESNQ